MDILKKVLDIILKFLRLREESKIQLEETETIHINQTIKTQEALKKRKKIEPKPPKNEDFFNDDSW